MARNFMHIARLRTWLLAGLLAFTLGCAEQPSPAEVAEVPPPQRAPEPPRVKPVVRLPKTTKSGTAAGSRSAKSAKPTAVPSAAAPSSLPIPDVDAAPPIPPAPNVAAPDVSPPAQAAAPAQPPTGQITSVPTSGKRPAWVDQPPGLVRGVFETKVIVGPEPTREACEQTTDRAVRSLIQDYAAQFGGGAPASRLNLRYEELLPRVRGEQWEERVTSSGAEVVFLHTQVKFDQQLQSQWRAAAADVTASEHSQTLIRVFLSAMWIVAVGHVLLRADERWEKHRGRIAAWLVAVVLIVLPFLG